MRRLAKSGFAAGLAAGLMAIAAIGASAVTPAPGTVKSESGFEFSNVGGYTAPGGGGSCGAYSPSSSFSFNVNVYNNSTAARDQAFNLQVYKMTQLSATTCYTEAQLEAMVHNGQNAAETQVVNSNTQSYSFAAGKPLPAAAGSSQTVTAGTALSSMACGYYQFDLGLTDTGSFAPRPGYAGPPVSGFLLVNGCTAPTPPSGNVSGSTSNNTHPTTSATQAATLATTGGGPLPLLPYALLLMGGLAVLVGVRTLHFRRR